MEDSAYFRSTAKYDWDVERKLFLDAKLYGFCDGCRRCVTIDLEDDVTGLNIGVYIRITTRFES